MPRIAIIGAGSVVFSKTAVLDLLASPLGHTEIVLMAPTTSKTPYVKRFTQRVITDNGLDATVEVTTDLEMALAGADYVMTTFNVGGHAATVLDYKIPMQYGIDQCIGDTLGPGGVFRAMRTIPVAIELAAAMERICPNALLLNYVNPMGMVCWAIGATSSITSVGLCHGVQVTLDLVAHFTGVPKEEIDYLSAGINHMAWLLRLEHDGHDLYPKLRERFEEPSFFAAEKVRGEVFRHFGYFMTESTGHLSEYLPYFRSRPDLLDRFCDAPDFGGQSGAHAAWSEVVSRNLGNGEYLDSEPSELKPRGIDYGAHIIEAMETGGEFRLQGNLRNDGLIDNLPDEACVEGPVRIIDKRLERLPVGALPDQCAALNQTNLNVQRLGVNAALNGDTEALVHACAFDPLSSAVASLDEIRSMVSEMLEAQRQWLPQFEGASVRPVPPLRIAPEVVPAEIPLDPALAVVERFKELAEADASAGAGARTTL